MSERGELTEFCINDNVTLDDIENIKCTDHACAAGASLVALRDAATARKVYFVYVEVPYSKGMLKLLASNNSKREKIMQAVDIGDFSSCKEIFDFNDIKKYVVEYNSEINAYKIINDQLDLGRFVYKNFYVGLDNLIRTNYDSFDNLKLFANKRINKRNRIAIGLVIRDDIRMIEQLNYLRALPFKIFSSKLLPGDEGDNPYYPGEAFNENNCKWYMAVSQLKDLIRTMTPVRSYEIDPDFVADWTDPESNKVADLKKDAQGITYKQVLAKKKSLQYDNSPNTNAKYNHVIKEQEERGESSYEMRLQKELEASDEARISPNGLEFYKWERLEHFYRLQWIDRHAGESKQRNTLIKDFPSYYNEKAYYNIEKAILDNKKFIDDNVPYFDEIYSKWVKKYIVSAIGCFEKGNIIHGLVRTNAITGMLDNGILGINSALLWKWLESSKEGDLIFAKAYSGGDSSLFKAMNFIQQWECDNKKIDLPTLEGYAKEIKEKAKDFSEKINEAATSYRIKGLKSVLFENELKDFFKSVEALKVTRGIVNSTLFVDEIGTAIKNNKVVMVDYRKSNRGLAQHRLAEELERVNPEFKNTVENIKYFSFDVSGRELKKISRKIKNLNLGESIDKFFDDAYDKFKIYNENSIHSVGNWASINNFDGPKIKLYMASSEDVADRYIAKLRDGENARKSSVDLLVESCKEANQKRSLKYKNLTHTPLNFSVSCLCLWILHDSANKFIAEGGWDNFWQMTSDFFAVMQDVCSRVESRIARSAVRISAGKLEAKSTSVILANSFKNASKAFSYGVAGIAFIQYLMDLGDVIEMSKKGEMKYVMRNKLIGSSLTFISSVVIAVYATSVIGGIVSLLAEVIFLVFFDTRHYLPENIMYWLRRSKYGYESDTVPGLKFESTEQAQNALALIWKGIVFSQKVSTGKTLKTRTETACSDGFCGEGEVPDVVEKKLEYKITFPKDTPVLLRVIRILSGDEEKEGFWYEYDGKTGSYYPLVMDMSSSTNLGADSLKQDISSLKTDSARDEFGTEYMLSSFSGNRKRLSIVFFPKFSEKDGIACISFFENIPVKWRTYRKTKMEFTLFSENENIYDIYDDEIFFDDRRVV